MLKKEAKAKALCLAMKLEIEEYKSPAYRKLIKKFKTSDDYMFKADLLNFFKSTSAMTQRLYFQILKDIDDETIYGMNKSVIFKKRYYSFCKKLKSGIYWLKRLIFSQKIFEYSLILIFMGFSIKGI